MTSKIQSRRFSKVKIGRGDSVKSQKFQNISKPYLVVAFVLIFGGIGAYLIIKSFAAIPVIYPASNASVTIGSWNTYVGNKNKLHTVVPQLMQTADVLGLQEVHTTTQRNSVKKYLLCSTCAYDGVMYKNKNTKNDKKIDSRGGYPIIWKKDTFKRIGNLGVKQMVGKMTGKIKFKARYAEWVTLQDMRTGKHFIVLNTHTYSRVEKNGGTYGHASVNSGYKKHMANLANLLKSLQKKNVPIFVVGDFNVDYKDDNGTMSWFPYNSLTPLGFVSNWKSANYTSTIPAASTSLSETALNSTSDEEASDTPAQQSVIGTFKSSSSGDRIIDYIFAWTNGGTNSSANRIDVSFQSTEIAGVTAMDTKGLVYGSDHTPIFATYVIGSNTSN